MDRRIGARAWGFGLYICQEVVRAHGGDIAVQSSNATGTTFTVQLRVLKARSRRSVAENEPRPRARR